MNRLLALLPFALPLLYIRPWAGPFQNELLRATVVVVAGAACFALLLLKRHRDWRSWQLITLLFVLIMIISSLLGSNVTRSIFGIPGDYQGLLLQLGTMAVAYYASRFVGQKSYWLDAAVISGLVCGLSLAFSLRFAVQGYRLSGLLLHDTGMALFAAMTIVLLLLFRPHRRWIFYSLLGSAITCLILSASRIGLLASLTTLGFLYIRKSGLRKSITICVVLLLSFVGLFALTPLPINRLVNPERINGGSSYRFELYGWALQQAHVSLVGTGSSSVIDTLANDPGAAVPDQIKDTFENGYPLWYSHNQYIDTYISYGLIGLLCFVYLTTMALWRNFRVSINDQSLALTCLLIVMIANVLVSTPSIELGLVMYLAIFGSPVLVALKKPNALQSTQASKR